MKKLFISVLFLLIAQIAFAQEELEVTVSDLSNQQAISGIMVRLENGSIGYSIQKATNTQGKAQFTALSTSGSYTVSVGENDQYFEARAENILVRFESKTKTKNEEQDIASHPSCSST